MFDHVASALARLNGVSTDVVVKVLEGPRADMILIPCRGAGLEWATVEAIILMQRPGGHMINDATIGVAHKDFDKLTVPNARRTMRFGQLQNKLAESRDIGKQMTASRACPHKRRLIKAKRTLPPWAIGGL
jgi:hypothetical protein